jgi:hypothetical protein
MDPKDLPPLKLRLAAPEDLPQLMVDLEGLPQLKLRLAAPEDLEGLPQLKLGQDYPMAPTDPKVPMAPKDPLDQ